MCLLAFIPTKPSDTVLTMAFHPSHKHSILALGPREDAFRVRCAGESQICFTNRMKALTSILSNADEPSYAIYVFNDGASSFTECAASRFYQTATATIAAITATTIATSVVTSTSTPSPTNASSNATTGSKMTTGQIVGLTFGILGGIGAFAGGIVGILKFCRKRRQKKYGMDSDGQIVLSHRGPFTGSTPEYHFHAPVTVNLNNSVVHLTGGGSGLGANMQIGERGRPVLGGGPSSRLIALDPE